MKIKILKLSLLIFLIFYLSQADSGAQIIYTTVNRPDATLINDLLLAHHFCRYSPSG